ncbi:MAG: hypothetical protein MUP22_09550 [Desulfobacterales bacterium]|nr:hypothetical protein [Desulfobacterales bacterium]
MTVRFKISATIFDCLPHITHWVINKRNAETANISEQTRAGLNFSIVLNSACFIEGALEYGLSSIISRQLLMEEGNDQFKNRLVEDLENRIRTVTGSSNYNSLFKLVSGISLSDLQIVAPLWEGIAILFHLRNVLAHGRAINFTMEFPGEKYPPDFHGFWDEEFKGGYKKVQDYLLKIQVIDKPFTEQSWELFFLTDEIADHFWSLALDFILGIGESLSKEDQQAFMPATMYGELREFQRNPQT